MKYISNFLTILSQLKVYHWQTERYSEHQAFGGAYEAISDLVDKFVEVYMGRYDRIFSPNESDNLDIYNIDSLQPAVFIKNVRTYLEELNLPDRETDTDLLNIRDEILAEIDKLSYLLTLK